MNQMKFSMLEMEILSSFHSFRDDGYVENISEHGAKVAKEFNRAYNESSETPGQTLLIADETKNLWIIYYLKLDTASDITIRTHEEMHVLHGSGNLKYLNARFLSQGLSIDLKPFDDFWKCTDYEKELVANLGVFHVFDMKGYDPRLFRADSIDVDPSFASALKMYQDALRSIKRELHLPST